MRVVVFIGMFFALASARIVKLPDYIKPCKRDITLNDCALEHGRAALPNILEGDKRAGIPALNPLKLPEVFLNPGENLKFKMTNLTIDGIQTAELKEIRIDLDGGKFVAEIDMDYITAVGDYEMEGRLIVPLNSKGPANISIHGLAVTYSFEFDVYRKECEDYIKINKDNVVFSPKNVHYELENLLSNKRLGDETNKLLNQNTGEIGNELNRVIGETIKTIVTRILNSFTINVPLSEIFV